MTEQPCSSTAATNSPSTYELRLQLGTEVQRLIALPWGKHSVGSGPRCSLRLDHAGVQPMECLIVQDASGLRVRRWSDNTKLNGESFDDSRLGPGDVLTVGPVELEVVCPPTEFTEPENPWAEITGWDSVDTSIEDCNPEWSDNPTAEVVSPAKHHFAAEHAFELSPLVLQPTEPNLDWETSASEDLEHDAETARLATATDEDAESKPAQAPAVRRRSSPRARAALRRQRKLYNQLLARFDDLERKIEQSLVETSVTAGEPTAEVDVAAAEATEIEQTRRQQELVSQLAQFREQLTSRDCDLHQARYSIDVLERQLIDSQRTMHAFAEERLTWESQFNELESRLADYVERIQELECQLEGVRVYPTDSVQAAIAPRIDWAAEPAADASTSVDEVVTETSTDSADETSVAGISTWADTVEEPMAEEAARIDATDVAPPEEPVVAEVAEEAAVESQDIDAALDHLKGLSIWREEPQIASESTSEVQSSVADETAPEAANPPPASFIDRYAHLFPSDDAPAEIPATPIEPICHAPTAHEAAASVAHGADEEESVEQYMAKLLERMRGPANQGSTDEQEAANLPGPSAAIEASTIVADEETAPAQEPITDLAELKTKPSIAEQASHRQAMRELAMQSARHAIGVHASRKLRRSMRTRSIIAVLGAAVAAYLLITAPGWKSLQFAAACVAGFVALYWGKLTMSTILEGIRLGAFDSYDDELDAEKSVHPPLPIDVEPPAHSEAEANVELVEHAEQR